MWTQFLLAALLWTCVGSFLLFRGLSAALKLDPAVQLAICLSAALIGVGKGLKVMRPTARKGAKRILTRGDGRCVMGFISWKTWLFVIGMALFGAALRRAGLPPWLLGVILCGVGTALLIGSWTYWTALFSRECRNPPNG
jgi:hypothetical protein